MIFLTTYFTSLFVIWGAVILTNRCLAKWDYFYTDKSDARGLILMSLIPIINIPTAGVCLLAMLCMSFRWVTDKLLD